MQSGHVRSKTKRHLQILTGEKKCLVIDRYTYMDLVKTEEEQQQRIKRQKMDAKTKQKKALQPGSTFYIRILGNFIPKPPFAVHLDLLLSEERDPNA